MTPGAIFCYKRHGQVRRAIYVSRAESLIRARPVSLADGQPYGNTILIAVEEVIDGT